MSDTSPIRLFLPVLIALAAGAGGAWYARSMDVTRLETERDELRRELRRSERSAEDYKAYAEAERGRIAPLKAELERIKQIRREQPAPTAPSAGTGAHGGSKPPDQASPPKTGPETWDESTYRRQLDRLAADAAQARKAQGYPLVLEALKLREERGRVFLHQLLASGLEARHKVVATMLLEDVGDAGAVRPMMEALGQIEAGDDPLFQYTLLNALAVLPGDEQTAVLLAAWNDAGDDVNRKRAGLRGLARRGHPIARAVALGKVPGVGKVLRYVALGNLHIRERDAGYEDPELRLLFEQSLASLDGPNQIDVVLEALAGYRSPASVARLRSFAEGTQGSAEQRARARSMAEEFSAIAPDDEARTSEGGE